MSQRLGGFDERLKIILQLKLEGGSGATLQPGVCVTYLKTQCRGRAVQIDPIKPTFKAPGAEPSKPNCNELLSNIAFNFNLRR